MIEIVTPAWSIPQSVPPRLVSVRAAARMTGSVNADSLLFSTSEPRNSFQDVMNANRATVTIAGTTAGRRHATRTCQVPPPSMTAASSSSRGTASKLLRMMYRLNGSWIVGVQDREAEDRVRQLELREHQEHRRQQRLVRDDQRQQQEDEDDLLARDREAGQGVAGRDRQAERDDDRQQRRAEAVRRGRPAGPAW